MGVVAKVLCSGVGGVLGCGGCVVSVASVCVSLDSKERAQATGAAAPEAWLEDTTSDSEEPLDFKCLFHLPVLVGVEYRAVKASRSSRGEETGDEDTEPQATGAAAPDAGKL